MTMFINTVTEEISITVRIKCSYSTVTEEIGIPVQLVYSWHTSLASSLKVTPPIRDAVPLKHMLTTSS